MNLFDTKQRTSISPQFSISQRIYKSAFSRVFTTNIELLKARLKSMRNNFLFSNPNKGTKPHV